MDLFKGAQDEFRLSPAWHQAARELGLDAMAIFRDPRIVIWRDIPERQNCLLEATLSDGTPIRWHIKRHRPQRGGGKTPSDLEAQAIRAMQMYHLPTVDLVGWGKLKSGYNFVITNDLTGFLPGDKFVEAGHSLDILIEPLALLAARLHEAGAYHQDMYLCHFFVRSDFAGQTTPATLLSRPLLVTPTVPDLMAPVLPAEPEIADEPIRLIDVARLKTNVPSLFRKHALVKDLAQFAYSLRAHPGGQQAWDKWFETYTRLRQLKGSASLRRSVERKVARIARHDQNLRRQQPNRNISIPQSPPPASTPK